MFCRRSLTSIGPSCARQPCFRPGCGQAGFGLGRISCSRTPTGKAGFRSRITRSPRSTRSSTRSICASGSPSDTDSPAWAKRPTRIPIDRAFVRRDRFRSGGWALFCRRHRRLVVPQSDATAPHHTLSAQVSHSSLRKLQGGVYKYCRFLRSGPKTAFHAARCDTVRCYLFSTCDGVTYCIVCIFSGNEATREGHVPTVRTGNGRIRGGGGGSWAIGWRGAGSRRASALRRAPENGMHNSGVWPLDFEMGLHADGG